MNRSITLLKDVIIHPISSFREISKEEKHIKFGFGLLAFSIIFASIREFDLTSPFEFVGFTPIVEVSGILLVYFIAKKLDGQAKFRVYLSAFGYASFPQIIGFILVPTLLVYSSLLGITDVVDTNNLTIEDFIFEPSISIYDFYGELLPYSLFSYSFLAWSFILGIIAVKEVFKFNYTKSIISIIIALIIAYVIVGSLAVVFAFTTYLPNLDSSEILDDSKPSDVPILPVTRDSIEVGMLPEEILFNPNSNMLYVSYSKNMYEEQKGIDVIDLTTYEIVDNISVPDTVSSMVVHPDTNTIYVAINYDKVPDNPDTKFDSLYLIDGNDNSVKNIFKAGGLLVDLTLDQNTNSLYAINHYWNTLMFMDLLFEEEPIYLSEFRSPRDVAFNPQTGMIYVTNGPSISEDPRYSTPSSLFVVDSKTNDIVANIDVGNSPRKIAVNPNTNMIYVTTMGVLIDGSDYNDDLFVVDGSTNMVIEKIGISTRSSCIEVNSKTNLIYIADPLENSVSVLDGLSNDITNVIPVGNGPCGMFVNEDANLIYLANKADSSISIINGSTHELIIFSE